MEIKEALERIETFRKLEQNWDSYGGYPPRPAAIDMAKKLVGGFFVSPVCDGTIIISLGDEDVNISIDGQGGVSVEIPID